MTRLLRLALVPLLAVAAAYVVYRCCYLPWRADVERKRLETITMALWQRQPIFASVRARENVVAARTYLDRGIHNTGLYMAAAANYRLFDDLDDAAAMYRAALRYDQRPELYYNLGIVELNRRHRAEAKAALVHAVLFNPWLIYDIDDPEMYSAAQAALASRHLLFFPQ